YLEIKDDEVILCVLPLAFDYGLYQMIMAFAAGARLVLERSFAYPAQVLKVMAEERVTGFPGVPTIFAQLAEFKSLRDYDLSSIRYVTNTAAALPQKHITMLSDLFPGARIYSMYGLTECKRCTYLPPRDRRTARHPRRDGDEGLLGKARGDGEEAEARAAAGRNGSVHRRLLQARRRGIPVLRRAQ